MGYVPNGCLEAVAPALAVVLGVPDFEEQFDVQCGDYVAVRQVGEGGEKAPCNIVTTRGKDMVVPRDLLGIIYE
jgi:hypothetical protein